MSREKFPRRLDAAPFLSRHSALLFDVHSVFPRLVILFRVRVSRVLLLCASISLVVTAPIVLLKHNKPDSCSLDEWQHMVLFETRGLWLCSIVREGIEWIRRLACSSTGPTWTIDTSPRNRASQEPVSHRRKWSPRMGRTLSQKRSNCLWFQIIGVETYLLLPDDQSDRRNFPRQG